MKKLTVSYFNAGSVRNKATAITDFLTDEKVDICAITETWLKDGTKDIVSYGDITPAGYKLEHIPREKRRGGGVAVIYKATLKAKMQKVTKHETFEIMEILLTARNDSIRLSVLYRPPSSPLQKFFKEFQTYAANLTTTTGKLLIAGDFNIPMDIQDNQGAVKFKELLESLNLRQHVKASTHRLGHTLDLIITREHELLLDSQIKIHPPLSDHKPLSFHCYIDKPETLKTKVCYRKTKDIDMCSFKEELANLPVMRLQTSDVNELVANYNKELTTLLDRHAPIITKESFVRNQSPWFNDELSQAKKSKRQAERKWIKNPLEINLQIFHHHKYTYLDMCKNAKKEFYQSQIAQHQGNQKELYKIANKLLYRTKDKSLPDEDNPEILANRFVNFFADKIKNITDRFKKAEMTKQDIPPNITLLHKFKETSLKDLKEIILAGNSKCCHLDPIPTYIVKDCIDTILPLLLRIVNLSLCTNVMPVCLKTATVTPLLKKKSLDIEELKNYRPVSNLSFLSKLIEKSVVKQLNMHMLSNDLYPCNQSAYRKFHSTETALVKILNDLLLAIDKKQCSFLVLFDQSAAFDTVNQDLMLHRLKYSFGITNDALEWLNSYFKHRHQKVCINGVSSECKELVTGFPQGSVLGPFMYPVYTSPLFNIVEKYGLSIHMYADDTQVYLSFKVNEENVAVEKLERCISDIRNWMFENHLKLNDTKTEFLVIGSKHMKDKLNDVSHISIGNSKVETVGFAKNIGAILDSNLDMTEHVNNVCRACYMHLHSISRVRENLTEDATATLVNALVTSRLDYANAILYGIPEFLIHKLQLVQNNAAKLILRKKKYDSVTPLLKRLHWLPIKYRIMYKINLLTFKCMQNIAPSYLSELCVPYEPARSLRSSNQCLLTERARRTNTADRAFSVAGPKLWNLLPDDVRVIEKLSLFKTKLKTHYFSKAFG